ncbi:inositol monophosphatase family protein [Micromonospora sp. CPCC 205539]|uniref:inositol monophosphatase family protein n=1 Tax=Micromonospora sp. CPCC 205539 TaxID=3122408 RepID=UPI002FF0DB15
MMELRPSERRTEDLLDLARRSARAAGDAIRAEFGRRSITQRRGKHDVQLRADLVAHEVIVKLLSEECPEISIVSEEGSRSGWLSEGPIWAVDPLDGTNNFGYGVAHCAVILSLFVGQRVRLAVVHDPLMGREFCASDTQPFQSSATAVTDPGEATVSLVSGYSEQARARAEQLWPTINRTCKRVLNLWAPGLDVALVADGAIDAMVCLDADLLDVCGGAYILKSAGGCLLDATGNELVITRSMHSLPVSFVAARSHLLARHLLQMLNEGLSTGNKE